MRLFHFSDDPHLELLKPRVPSRHPDREPFVYAVDEAHQALYFFPPDCPRLAVWADSSSRAEDVEWLQERTDQRILLAIDSSWADRVARGSICRYLVSPESFFQENNHGCFVSRLPIKVATPTIFDNLPQAMREADAMLAVVGSLSAFAHSIESSTLHVTMIRMGLLDDWVETPGFVHC